MTTTFPHPLNDILSRIEGMGLLTADYDVMRVWGALYNAGQDVDEVSDLDLGALLLRYTIEEQTEVPCPDWCNYEHGHRFELSNADGTEQSRHHARRFLVPTDEDRGVGEFYVAVTAEETRVKPVDATARMGRPYVMAVLDGELTVEQARRFATALTLAADALDRLAQ